MSRPVPTHVLAMPCLDPGERRVELELPAGLTLREIVDRSVPGLHPDEELRVALVTDRGSEVILPGCWRFVRPKPGVRVVIRLVPGKDGLRTILTVVIAVAAVAAGAWVAGAMGFAAGTTGYAVVSGLVGLGVTFLGQLLVNALIPPPKEEKPENRYTISGWRNRLDPDGAVPQIFGTMRYAPPFAARSYTQVIGDWQYVVAAFCFGYGPVQLTDFKIGETSLSEYDEVEIEVRQGLPGDDPLSLYPRQVIEENVGAELTRPLPRDDLGNVIGGEPAEEKPVVRTTGSDASGASVILAWPAGMFRMDDDGDRHAYTVSIRIEQRPVESETWLPVTTLEIQARKLEAFFRQHSWSFPSRGRWQVRLTMMTDEVDDTKLQARTAWAALQTLRPEYPLAFDQPLALAALRIKATHQLNGQLDNFTAVGAAVCLDWDHETETWTLRATSNPAALYRAALQSPANPKPVTDAGIDLAALADWHDFCRLNDLRYDRVQDSTSAALRDVLTEIAAAGRAAPRHDGARWTVTIDRPQDLIVDHISPRNSHEFRLSRRYFEPPHAVRVAFLDAENDFERAERIIKWPDFDGDPTLIEALDLPGKTRAPEVFVEATRRMLEAIHRPDGYRVIQDGAARVATRGDLVTLSHDVISRVHKAARVKAVAGQLVLLDDVVAMDDGESYAIRFRHFDSSAEPEDTVGTSEIRTVRTEAGETDFLTLEGAGLTPEVGDLIHFGPASRVDRAVVVRGVEAGENLSALLHLVDAAPEIDDILAATSVPPWSPRAGAELEGSLTAPPAPRFTLISWGYTGGGGVLVFDREISYLLVPGSSATLTTSYTVEHRIAGGEWTAVTIPAANGGGTISGYTSGNMVEMRAKAVSFDGVVGPYTAIVSFEVGAGDAPIPAALDDAAIVVTTLLGGALVQVATGSDGATTQLQLYRSTSATLDRATDATGDPIAVTPLGTFSVAVGDTTREDLISGGSMSDPGAWTLDAGWDIAAGVATHTPGTADAIDQALTATAGKWYRLGLTVAGRTAGTVTPQLTGGSDRPGAAISADGEVSDRIQAVTGNDRFELLASSDFDGSIDDVVAYLETNACLAQGTHYLWVEPQNADGVPGPLSGPFTINII